MVFLYHVNHLVTIRSSYNIQLKEIKHKRIFTSQKKYQPWIFILHPLYMWLWINQESSHYIHYIC